MNVFEMRLAILNKIIPTAEGSDKRNVAEFCRTHNFSKTYPAYLSQVLNGTKNMGDNAAIEFENTLGLPPGTLSAPQLDETGEFEAAPEIRNWRVVDIKGTAQLGDEGFWCELESADGCIEVISNDPAAYALRTKGDSMHPAIRNGWVVWCEPSHELVSGEYVMVKTVDGRCMIKELLYHNNIEVSLMSINHTHDRINIPIENIEHIHYVGGIVSPSKIRY